jgi:hypothetical protein
MKEMDESTECRLDESSSSQLFKTYCESELESSIFKTIVMISAF